MKVPARIGFPIALAGLCTLALLSYLWWELRATTAALTQPPTAPAEETEEVPGSRSLFTDIRDSALLHLREGDVFALRGEWRLAQEKYESAVEEGGGLPALRKLVQAQLQRRDNAGAQSTIRRMKAEGARAEDILLLESIVLLRSGELVSARLRLDNAGESPHKHYGLALLGIIEGDHERSRAELKNVIGGWEPVLRSQARTLASAYEEFALFPESSDAHLIALLARALAQVQECEIALPLINQVTQEVEDYRDAWIVQGYCELVTERSEQALASLEKAYNIDPQKPEIQYFLARAYAAIGQHGNAITFFEYALQNGFEPQSDVRFMIAESAMENEDVGLALKQYEFLTEASPSFDVFSTYVELAIAQNQSASALSKAEKARTLFPEDARASELYATAALAEGKREEAITALKEALEMNPGLRSAREKLEQIERN